MGHNLGHSRPQPGDSHSEQRGNREMANTENLRPWKPGQSGNPGGRPKRDAITAALREQLESQREDATGSVADAIAAVLVKRALGGDVRAIREIADRTEGRRQQIKVEAQLQDSEDRVDLSGVSDDELRQVQEILDRARV